MYLHDQMYLTEVFKCHGFSVFHLIQCIHQRTLAPIMLLDSQNAVKLQKYMQ